MRFFHISTSSYCKQFQCSCELGPNTIKPPISYGKSLSGKQPLQQVHVGNSLNEGGI